MRKLLRHLQVQILNFSILANYSLSNSSAGNVVYVIQVPFRVTAFSTGAFLQPSAGSGRRLLMHAGQQGSGSGLAGTLLAWQRLRMDDGQSGLRSDVAYMAPALVERPLGRHLLADSTLSVLSSLLQTRLQLVASAFPSIVQCNDSRLTDWWAGAQVPMQLSDNCSTAAGLSNSSLLLNSYLNEVGWLVKCPFLKQLPTPLLILHCIAGGRIWRLAAHRPANPQAVSAANHHTSHASSGLHTSADPCHPGPAAGQPRCCLSGKPAAAAADMHEHNCSAGAVPADRQGGGAEQPGGLAEHTTWPAAWRPLTGRWPAQRAAVQGYTVQTASSVRHLALPCGQPCIVGTLGSRPVRPGGPQSPASARVACVSTPGGQ